MLLKIDDYSGRGLPGAEFSLQGPDGDVQSGSSDCQGKLCFQVQPGRQYTLRETAAPPGYARLPDAYSVRQDTNGNLEVDGVPVRGLALANSKLCGTRP